MRPNGRRLSTKSPIAATTIEGPDGSVRQTIETTLASTDDQSILPDKPLVVGPLYKPNPELKGNPGGELPDSEMPPCPPAAPAASG